MNAPARVFNAVPAVRGEQPLLVGLTGGPGAGKTFSALTLATGMQRVRGGDIIVIDTEAGRAKKYADRFSFKHVTFEPPFNPEDFLSAVRQQLPLNPACIIIDSASDEHEGAGGVLDIQARAVEDLAARWKSSRENVGQAAWNVAKEPRKKMMSGFLQIKVPLIFCFRAREKTRQLKNDRGKVVPTNIGWQPIAPSEIVHNMDVMCVLPLKSDGVPMWHSDKVGEDFVIKLPEQFKSVFTDGRPLNADMGEALAKWARGEAIQPPVETVVDEAAILAAARDAARSGKDALQAHYKPLSKLAKAALKPHFAELTATATEADAVRAEPVAVEIEGDVI